MWLIRKSLTQHTYYTGYISCFLYKKKQELYKAFLFSTGFLVIGVNSQDSKPLKIQ